MGSTECLPQIQDTPRQEEAGQRNFAVSLGHHNTWLRTVKMSQRDLAEYIRWIESDGLSSLHWISVISSIDFVLGK